MQHPESLVNVAWLLFPIGCFIFHGCACWQLALEIGNWSVHSCSGMVHTALCPLATARCAAADSHQRLPHFLQLEKTACRNVSGVTCVYALWDLSQCYTEYRRWTWQCASCLLFSCSLLIASGYCLPPRQQACHTVPRRLLPIGVGAGRLVKPPCVLAIPVDYPNANNPMLKSLGVWKRCMLKPLQYQVRS